MAEQELWTELLKQMHRRYEAVNEVFRLTKEIADTLSRDDRVAAQMLLGMRQEEIEHLSAVSYTHLTLPTILLV